MIEVMDLLKTSTEKVHSLNPADWEAFSKIWHMAEAPRFHTLTSQGETETKLYFITEGLQRIYYENQQREATLVFTYSGSFGGILNSFITGKPSIYAYETLTKSKFLYASKADLDVLVQERAEIGQLITKGMGSAMSGLLERLVETQCYSSEEKFRSLLKRSPHILNLVPQKYLASYIGIDPTNFSKLINTIKI